MNGRVLTVQEAAVYTGRSQHFIRQLIAAHEVTARKTGGRWYVSRPSLDTWINAGQPVPTVGAVTVPPMRWTHDAA